MNIVFMLLTSTGIVVCGAFLQQAVLTSRRVAVRSRLFTDSNVSAESFSSLAMRLSTRGGLAIAALSVCALVLSGLTLAVIFGVVLVLTRLGVSRWLANRENQALHREVPDALHLIAQSLRAGSTVAQAIVEVGDQLPGPVGADLRHAGFAVARGGSVATELGIWSDRRANDSVALAGTVLTMCLDAGGLAASAVEGASRTLRQQLEAQEKMHAQSAQVRLSMIVLVAAPLFFTMVVGGMNGDAMQFLLHSPLGAAFLIAGLSLDAVGALWVTRMTKGVA